MAGKCPGMSPANWTPKDVDEQKCPACGMSLEFWKDDVKRICPECGKAIFNSNVGNTCLAWCPSAVQCMGNDDIEKWKKRHDSARTGKKKSK